MTREEKDSALVNAIADMQEEQALALVRGYIAEGMAANHLLDLSRRAMEVVGARFEKGEYFLPELIMAAEMLRQIAALVKPLLAKEGASKGPAGPAVLIGTVRGDVHDIGKDIVTFVLEVNGFNVIDLGVDVPVETFVDSIRQHKAAVVGLSGFLTMAYDAMRDTVQAITNAGLREGVKIMIGGGQVDEGVRKYTGADAFGLNAMDAVTLCRGWLGSGSAGNASTT